MTDKSYEYECALSGLTSPGDQVFDDDGLEDLPAGWVEVRMSRRIANPRWTLIQQVKEAMVEGVIQTFPEEVWEGQRIVVALQVDAQFFGLEQTTAPYITVSDTVYLAPPEVSPDVHEAINEVRDMLGMEPIDLDSEMMGVDEESEEAAPAPEPPQIAEASAPELSKAAKKAAAAMQKATGKLPENPSSQPAPRGGGA